MQQSCNISSPDVLMALDYCEESLQEIDVTSFLNTLCGHIRVFREHGGAAQCSSNYPTPFKRSTTFVIGDSEEEKSEERPTFTSSSRY